MDRLKHMIASNKYSAGAYDRINVFVHKGDRERLHKAKTELGHGSINDMILAALEQYTGLTGLRLKGEKEE